VGKPEGRGVRVNADKKEVNRFDLKGKKCVGKKKGGGLRNKQEESCVQQGSGRGHKIKEKRTPRDEVTHLKKKENKKEKKEMGTKVRGPYEEATL